MKPVEVSGSSVPAEPRLEESEVVRLIFERAENEKEALVQLAQLTFQTCVALMCREVQADRVSDLLGDATKIWNKRRTVPSQLMKELQGLIYDSSKRHGSEGRGLIPDGFIGAVVSHEGDFASKESFSFWWQYSFGRVIQARVSFLGRHMAAIPARQIFPEGGSAQAGHVLFLDERRGEVRDLAPFMCWSSDVPAVLNDMPGSVPAGETRFVIRKESLKSLYAPLEKLSAEWTLEVLDSVDPKLTGKILSPFRPAPGDRAIINCTGNCFLMRTHECGASTGDGSSLYAAKILRLPYDRQVRERFDQENLLLRSMVFSEDKTGKQGFDTSSVCVAWKGVGLVRCRGESLYPFFLTEYVPVSIGKAIEDDRNVNVVPLSREDDLIEAEHLVWMAKRVARILYVAEQVANILKEFNKKDLAHRNITPDNLLSCGNGRVRLCDFSSLMKRSDVVDNRRRTQQGNFRSQAIARASLSRRYCAPEVWENPFVPWLDGKEDVYSLGKVLEEVLFGGSCDFDPEVVEGAVSARRSIDPADQRILDELDKRIAAYAVSRQGHPVWEPVRKFIDNMTVETQILNRRSIADVHDRAHEGSALLRNFVADVCQAEIDEALKLPLDRQKLKKALACVATLFGYRSHALKLPQCHRLEEREDVRQTRCVEEIVEKISTGSRILSRNDVSVAEAASLLGLVGKSLKECPGLVDLAPDESCSNGRRCLAAHCRFCDVNNEWAARKTELDVSEPMAAANSGLPTSEVPAGRLATEILMFIARTHNQWRGNV